MLLDPNVEREKKREEEKKKKEELTQLFKPVAQTVAKGVDPKSVVCAYFKQGICQKGDRCKFSHDLAVERKSEKRNIYEDMREESKDTMENWDEQKLNDVVNQKHGDDNKKKNQTQIVISSLILIPFAQLYCHSIAVCSTNKYKVCKFFIEAVENATYGWFWSCPNGDSCMYRHALPPGFTLKSVMKKKSEEEEISIEMLIEKERASLGVKVTKVTLESFLAWKKRKLTEKRDEIIKKEEKKRADYKLGFVNGLTGRDLFTFNPDLITDGDDGTGGDDVDYRLREDDDGEGGAGFVARDINADFFASQAREADDTGTVATNDRFAYLQSLIDQESDRQRQHKEEKIAAAAAVAAAAGEEGEEEEDDDEAEDDDGEGEEEEDGDKDQESEAASKPTTSKAAKGSKKLEIDESLFNLDDLADIQDELEDLEI